MRVIAGSARSVPLEAPKGTDVRPTTDKIKETLFNMLQFDVPGSLFVDCFSGSGAIGIEALSRAAEKAILIDHSRDAIQCIEKNLKRCHLEDKAVVLKMEAVSAIPSIRRYLDEDTDVIYFLDPPYDREQEYILLEAFSENGMIRENDLVILETSLEKGGIERLPQFLKEIGLEIIKEKQYKNQRHVFIRKRRNHEDSDLSGKF